MSVSKHELDDNQLALLRTLNRPIGRPWITGIDATAGYLGVKTIRPYHLTKINEMIAFSREMRELGLLEARENPKHQLFNWDLRITSQGKRCLRSKATFPAMLGAAVAVSACSSFLPHRPEAPQLPPKASIAYRQVVVAPNMVQVRDENGVVAWKYCTDDCPLPTPKVMATASVEVRPKSADAGKPSGAQVASVEPGQKMQETVKQALAAAMQKNQTPTSAPAGTTTRTLNYAVFFNLGSAALSKDGKQAIRELAPDLMRAESINIIGRADPTGTTTTNERLSKARGEAVKAQLVHEGVSASKIELDSRVEIAQLDAKTTALTKQPTAIHDQNRRTDMTVDLLVLRGR